MNCELDSKEVLMHLYELGYKNITPKQLEEFMTDLKRLIKHDTMKKRLNANRQAAPEVLSPQPTTTDESPHSSPVPTQRQRKRDNHGKTGIHHNVGHNFEVSGSSSESSIPSSRKVLRECTKLAAQKSEEKLNVKNKGDGSTKSSAKPTKSCDCMWRRIGCKCCDENWAKEQLSVKTSRSKENLAPPRPKSSFIRTWQVTGQGRPGSAPQRCDPVTLYHQYQQLWKQQKLPGESSHNDLRWSIRERMLGQDTQPRSLSQASSVTSVNRQRKRL